MATPADQRLLELLEKWLKSLELHLKYSSLNDESYSKIQPWPEHQRPTRWIIDLARQKAASLHAQVQDRIKVGDATFSDSLELTMFLANLVGSEQIERFIPLANTDTEGVAQSSESDSATATREMPLFPIGIQREPPSPGMAQVARTERRAPEAVSPTGTETVREQVITDAARLVQWGRKWYELAELISNMADRPSLTEVRRILQDNKTVIDRKAGRA